MATISWLETFELLGQASAPAVSPSGRARIYYDSAGDQFLASRNAGAYLPLVLGNGGAFVYEWGCADLAGANAATKFLWAAPVGTGTIEGTEGRGQRVMVIPGTFTLMRMRVRINAGGSARSWTATLRVNEADTALTQTIADMTTVQDATATGSVHVTAGQRVSVGCTTDLATSAVWSPFVTFAFIPDPS
jgi:hypothetical protein